MKLRLFLNIVALIGLPAFIWLFSINWQIAVAVFLILFSNNLALRAKDL